MSTMKASPLSLLPKSKMMAPPLHTLTGVVGGHGVVGALREMPTGVFLLIIHSDIAHLVEHLIAVVGVLVSPLTLKLWEPCKRLPP